jgi:hypothetical protein
MAEDTINNLFGAVRNPFEAFNSPYGSVESATGLTLFISNVIKLVIIAGGLFAFFNLIIAGFQYISAGSDPKATAAAWSRIYMSLIGLLVLVSSITIITILSIIFLGDPFAILRPTFYGPGKLE